MKMSIWLVEFTESSETGVMVTVPGWGDTPEGISLVYEELYKKIQDVNNRLSENPMMGGAGLSESVFKIDNVTFISNSWSIKGKPSITPASNASSQFGFQGDVLISNSMGRCNCPDCAGR